MAGRGTRATATDFNNIQTAVASVLGTGSGTSGYGQFVTSSPVGAGATITVAQWTALRNDLSKARVHQTNTAVVDGLASVAANRGSPWQTLQVINSSTTISEDIRDQYNQFANGGVVTSKDTLAASGQSTSGIAVTSTTRSTSWGSPGDASISHIIQVVFYGYTPTGASSPVVGADHMRCFFNAGGSLQITASRTGTAATTKDTDWTSMLSGFGTLTFRAASTSISGTVNAGGTVGTTVGFRSLSVGASATNILTQTSSATKYAENRYTIDVRRPTATNQLEFVITFRDADVGDQTGLGPAVDELVTGTITSACTCTRPSGSNVDIPAPLGSATTL